MSEGRRPWCSFPAHLLSVVVLFALGACGSCSKVSSSPLHCPGGQGCVCTMESPCDATLTCGAAGACEACVDGKAGCACLASGACDSGLACQGNLCAVCQPGAEGCACGDGSTCSAGLSCQAGLCVSTSCADRTTDCACDAGGTCGGGTVCIAGICRSCASDAPGCACDAGGACQGFVCERGTCRAGLSCGQAGCAPHQSCAAGGASQDASCLAQCAPGFTWNTPNRACDPTPGATCALGVTGSIGQACAELFRPCVSTAAGAECGGCLEGYVEEDGACRAVRTCDALGCAAQHLTCTSPGPHADASCGACEAGHVSSNGACVLDPTQTCVALQPQCEALHMECVGAAAGASCQGCKPGYILDPTTAVCRPPYSCAILDTLPTKCDATEECIPATATSDAFCRVPCRSCNQPGEDGVYPQYTLTHRCICQTKPGYFYTLADRVGTFPCDADGDGWTRDTAWFAITSDDPAIWANARCGLHTIDRFVLHNEIGQRQTIHLDLQEGLPLYESARNDDDTLLNAVAGSPQLPRYGPDRTLAAAELNSLTKACVGELADHNDNRVSDVEEWGRPVLDGSPEQPGQSTVSGVLSDVAALYALYTRHSYFVELDRGWYEPPGANEMFGAYHIAEKKREVAFNDNFPLRYGIEEGTQRLTSDYWRACPRARDFWYSAAGPTIGQDFASVSAPDRVWKGMMHHSQFKCVQIVDEGAYASISDHAQARHQQTTKTLQAPPDKNVDGSALTREQRAAYLNATPNSCAATLGSTPVRGGSNPLEPILTCAPVAPADLRLGQVLWAAVRINMDPSSYARGCLLQCPGHPFICPGADPSKPAPDCYQICGDFAGSERRVLGNPGEKETRVQGEIPVSPVVDKPIGTQGRGYFIRQVP